MRRLLIVYSLITLFLLLILGAQAGLEQYPNFFVQGSDLDVTIVYGESASSREAGAAYTLADSLEEHFTNYNNGLGSGTQSAEDVVYTVEDLELEEAIGEEQETLTEDDFPELLPSGTISTPEGDTDYDQYLRFESADTQVQGLRFVYDVYEEEQAIYLLGEKDDFLFEWEIDFAQNLESDINDDDQLEDMLDEELNILGTDMIISHAELNGNVAELSFLRKDKELHLVEGQPQQVTIGDTTYTIEAERILDGSSEVILSVDGETSDTLEEGERDRIDDLYLVVLEVLLNEAQEGSVDTASAGSIDTSIFQDMTEAEILAYLAESTVLGGEDVVKIALGTQYIDFQDSYDDTEFSQNVRVNSETIENAFVKIQGIQDQEEFQLDKIVYRAEINPEDENEVYLEQGEGVRQYLDEPDVMLGDSWDIIHAGLQDIDTSEVHFDPSNDESYDLTFTNIAGDECEMPLLDNSNEGGLGFHLGDENNHLLFIECTGGAACMEEGDYFVVSDDNDHTGRTTILEYRSHAESSSTITFKNHCTEQTIEETYTGTPGVDATGEITLHGQDFSFMVGADDKLAVDQNKDGDINEQDKALIITLGGLRIDLGASNEPAPGLDQGFSVFLSVEEELFDEQGPFDFGGNENVEIFLVNRDENEVDLIVENQNHLKVQSGDEAHINKGMSPYGVLYAYDDEPGQAGELTLEVPEEQVLGNIGIVRYAQPVQQQSSATPIDLSNFNQNYIGVDSDVFSATADNLIVVGNACTNTITSSLLNTPSVCGAGMKDNTGLLYLLTHGAKKQILVAGKTEEDIIKAANVLADFSSYNLNGDIFEITGTATNPQVTKVTLADWEAQLLADLGTTDDPVDPIDPPPEPTPVTTCNDGIDNDGDGRIDYPLDPGCSNAQDSDETDVVQPPPVEENIPEPTPKPQPEEEKSNAWIWIVLGIILIGGAGGAAWWVMKKHAATVDNDAPPPQGYTKQQWKDSLAYYKEHYPEWYSNYMQWLKQQKSNGKEIALIALLLGVSIIGLAMIITVSLPGQTSVGLAGDMAGQATGVITCTHQITGDQFSISGSATAETLNAYLCLHPAGSWQCSQRGIITQGLYCR